jgi:ABC-type antimicrobial peptide transport system permease subunit
MKKGLVIIGIVILIVGIVLAVGMIPLTTKSPKQLEDELEGETIEDMQGESWTVSGTIDEKAEIDDPLTGQTIYTYKFKDADIGFSSAEDVANEGDSVIVNVEVTELGLEATSTSSPAMYYLPGIVILIVGVILMVLGLKKKKVEQPQPYP